MKFYALIAAMLLSGSIAFAHTDPIVMIIDGQSVKKSEFEYFYQKNHLGNTVDSKRSNKWILSVPIRIISEILGLI